MMKTDKRIRNFGIRTIANFAFAICAVFILSVSAAQAAVYTVNSNADSGTGTLRDAITLSNASTGVFDTINFSGVTSIALTTPLPAITDPVTIDGGTSSVGPAVELNGLATRGAGIASIGLYIKASSTTVQGLTINRFGEAGIRIDGAGSGSSILNNSIGLNRDSDTDICSTGSCGNINRGVLIVGATNVLIGNGTAAGRNRISGNQGRGIEITAGGSAIVSGNLIGIGNIGNVDLGNTSHGIFIVNSSGSTIGGTTEGARNIISGNNGSGIFVVGDIGTPASNNVIIGNFIGVTVTGTSVGNTALPNNGSGVVIQDANNTVGGTTAAARNVISGNGFNGVSISGSLATGNIVQGNFIGVGADSTTVVRNRDNGVQISNQAIGNTIGGTGVTPGSCNGACNVIANNGDPNGFSARAGIYLDITAGVGNRLRGNSIFNNTGLGIDLGVVGTTANDAMDPDGGANNLQNFPVLDAADNAGMVTGTFNSTPNTSFVIEFFSNAAPDTAATSEARTFVGSTTVMTNGGGDAVINSNLGGSTLATGQFVTATATSSATNDTSEISAARLVLAAPGGGAQGIEADISPRGATRDNIVNAEDIVQIRRFVNRTDTIDSTTNEFQRADSANFNPTTSTYGDGTINADDVVQTRRYANRSDPPQPAAGPTGPTTGPQAGRPSESSLTANEQSARLADRRQLSVQNASGSPGNPVTVNILVDSMGDEAEYSFTINYNQNVLMTPVIMAGNVSAGSTACNATTTPGQIFCSIGTFPNNSAGSNDPLIGEIAPVTGQILVRVTFTIRNTAQPSTTTLVTLTDVAAADDNPATPTLAITSMNGTVTISGPTAAAASISGRVVKSDGVGLEAVSVKLFDTQSGQTFSVITDEKGNYQFADISVGHDYIITPISKVYTFNPTSRFLSLTEDLTVSTFTATGKKTFGR